MKSVCQIEQREVNSLWPYVCSVILSFGISYTRGSFHTSGKVSVIKLEPRKCLEQVSKPLRDLSGH